MLIFLCSSDAAVDDIEQGKGVDEEISLLPDAEREISDADKQRALQAGEVDDTDDADEGDEAVIMTPLDDAANQDATQPTAAGSETADTTDANDDEQAPGGSADLTNEQWTAPPKDGEIKELQSGWSDDRKCIQCLEKKLCKFTLLPMRVEAAAVVVDDAVAAAVVASVDSTTATDAAVPEVSVEAAASEAGIVDEVADQSATTTDSSDAVAPEADAAAVVAAVPSDASVPEVAAPETAEVAAIAAATNEPVFLCDFDCVHAYRDANADKTITLTVRKVPISMVADSTQTCTKCAECTICKYRFRPCPIVDTSSTTTTESLVPADYQYICTDTCLSGLIGRNHEKFTIRKKRAVIEELLSETTDKFRCIQCYETVACRFNFRQDDDEPLHICQEDCLNLLMKEQPDRFRIKRRSVRVRDLPKRAGHGSATAAPPADTESTSDAVQDGGGKMLARTEAEAEVARRDREASFLRRCAQCFSIVYVGDRSLVWETYDFCDEACLGQYQHVVGAACTMCQNAVTLTSLGKYCVRFGYEIRQFCRATCLDEFKKGLKVCSYCQKDISKNADGFLASVAGQFKDFCTQTCYRRYDEMCNPSKKQVAGICAVCNTFDPIRVEILVDGKEHGFCSSPCFSAFKFVNNIVSGECRRCFLCYLFANYTRQKIEHFFKSFDATLKL